MSPVMNPGWFSRNAHKYLTLSEVPRALNVMASEITDAIARGDITVERISGCKAIPVAELFRYIEKREVS